MLPVEPRRLRGADKKLRSVGVGTRVRHGEDPRPGVLLREVLVLELIAVDRLPAGPVPGGEIASLAHEPGDHAVEGRSLEVERLPLLSDAFLAGAEGSEVLGGVRRRVFVKLHHDAACGSAVEGHVEEDPWVSHFDRKRERSKRRRRRLC